MGTRERQRAATRAAIIDAATAAFVAHGYAGTSITAIAAAAEVSPEGVYLIFTNKRTLLGAVIETAAHGDGTAVVDPSWLDAVRAEPDPRARLALMAAATRDVLRRTMPVDAVARAAALSDPEIAELCRRNEERRRRDVRTLVDLLAEAGPLRVPVEQAVDLMWALSRSTDLYRSLTADRGWSDRRAQAAVEDVLARVLLP